MNHTRKSILITGGCGKIGSYFARFAATRYALRIADKVAWNTEKLGPRSAAIPANGAAGCR